MLLQSPFKNHALYVSGERKEKIKNWEKNHERPEGIFRNEWSQLESVAKINKINGMENIELAKSIN